MSLSSQHKISKHHYNKNYQLFYITLQQVTIMTALAW